MLVPAYAHEARTSDLPRSRTMSHSSELKRSSVSRKKAGGLQFISVKSTDYPIRGGERDPFLPFGRTEEGAR